jgi:predicted RNA-binding Zn-ribbon protein involved in translation (DUF1610 family)
VNNTIKIAAAAVLIVLAIVLYFARAGDTKSTTDWTNFNASLACMDCGHAYQATVEVGDPPPYTCPECGKKNAWRQKQCRECGEIFLPPLEGDPPWPPMIARCPKCKSQATGAVKIEPQKPQ